MGSPSAIKVWDASWIINILFALTVIRFNFINAQFIEIDSSDELLIALESGNNNIQAQSYHKWFTQLVNHFNKSDHRQWEQRYFEYGGFHKRNGPIFLHVDGEGPGLTSPIDFIKKGSMAQYAKEQGAYIIALEHRFYGLSHPTTDLSTENLKYLNIGQAIGDIATFITWFKAHRNFKRNKWVLFGSSYGGSLAKWFSEAHPNLTDVLVASSAPLELKYEMSDYLMLIGDVINKTDPKCFQDLSDGFDCLDNSVSGNACGKHRYLPHDLTKLFNLCGDFRPERQHDISGLFFTIFNTFHNIVVNNIPDPRLNVSLEGVCRRLTTNSNSGSNLPLNRLARVIQEITQASEASCVEYRLEKVVKYLETTTLQSLGSINGDRQFQWQRCNELGWVKGSSIPLLPFGGRISTSFHAQICKKIFGLTEEQTMQNIDEANRKYKGKIISGECGIYVNGKADPWSRLGVTSDEEVGMCNQAIFIEGASHAKDKGNILPDISTILSYPPDLRPAQKAVGKTLDTWLKGGNCCDGSNKLKVAGGRILSERYFYPIPNQRQNPKTKQHTSTTQPPRSKQPYPSPTQLPLRPQFIRPKQKERVIFPSDLAVKTVKIPNNELTADETRRVETRTKELKEHRSPGRVDIQSNIEFKELTDFIRTHEKELFPGKDFNSPNSTSEGKRYRVKIRPLTKRQRRPTTPNRSETFSKFGVNMEMRRPDSKEHEDLETNPPKKRNRQQEPWWLYQDTFEPRKVAHQDSETKNIDESINDDPFKSHVHLRSRKPKDNNNAPRTRQNRVNLSERNNNPEINEDGPKDTINSNAIARGEKKLVILNLNAKNQSRFGKPEEDIGIHIQDVKRRALKPVKIVRLIPRKHKKAENDGGNHSGNQEDFDSKPFNRGAKAKADFAFTKRISPNEISRIYPSNLNNPARATSDEKGSDEQRSERLPIPKILQSPRSQESHRVFSSERKVGSHETPLYSTKPKPDFKQIRDFDANDGSENISGESGRRPGPSPKPRIKIIELVPINPAAINETNGNNNGPEYDHDQEIFTPSERRREPTVVFVTADGQVFRSNGMTRQITNINVPNLGDVIRPYHIHQEPTTTPRPLRPKPTTPKPFVNNENSEDEFTQTTLRRIAETKTEDDNVIKIRCSSAKDCEGFILSLVRNQGVRKPLDTTTRVRNSGESSEPVSASGPVKPIVVNAVKIRNSDPNEVRDGNQNHSEKRDAIKSNDNIHHNSTASSPVFSKDDNNTKNDGPSNSKGKVFVNVQGTEIPVENLDWRAALNPEGPIVDLSVGLKPDNLALTGRDVAWVNYGIPPWQPSSS